MKQLLPLVLAILTGFITKAQVSGPVSGLVQEAESQKPLEGATISLLAAKDSSIVRISISDKTGGYSFEPVKDGSYLVLASAAAHQKIYSAMILVSGAKPVQV